MTSTMKAAVYTEYGAPEVLQIREVAKPEPKDNEILVKIHATAVTSADSRLRKADEILRVFLIEGKKAADSRLRKADPFAVRFVFGLFKPRKPVLGGVFSGEIEATGKNVKKFRAGDRVFGSSYPHFGAYAEYVCLPETATVALKPDNISHDEAVALPFGGLTALSFLRKAGIRPGQKVLIYGASGAVGTAAVQIAKYLGAEVTGVCSTANVEMVASIGADKVIDYTKTDFSKSGEHYDVVFETVNKAPFSSCVAALKEEGTLILGSATPGSMLRGAWMAMTSGKKVISGQITETVEALGFLRKMAEEGKLKAVVDRKYPLEQIAEAHAYVDAGHKKGNVVVGLR